jgi:hypothetical protein
MANPESKPGIIEKGSKILRDAEIAIAGILVYFGHMGVAALAAIGAVIDHATAKYFEKRRLGKATA